MLSLFLAFAAPLGIIMVTGTLTTVSVDLVNPYSGATLSVAGDYYVNDTHIDGGPGTSDVLIASGDDQFFQLGDSEGGLLLEGFEFFIMGNGADILILASSDHLLGDVNMDLGNQDDIFWGNAGNDTLGGSNGDDQIHGGPGNDDIDGSNDDDDLWGGQGNDTLEGGAGTDTAHYPGAFADYLVTDLAGVLTIDDLVGDQGTDTVTNVELIRFADGVLSGGTFLPFPVEVTRNGTPPNPEALLPGLTSGPAVGAIWDPVIDHTTFVPSSAADFLLVTLGPLDVFVGVLGTLLCDVTGPVLEFISAPGPGMPFVIPIPNDPNLIGLALCAQGGSVDPGLVGHLSNALDVLVGTPVGMP